MRSGLAAVLLFAGGLGCPKQGPTPAEPEVEPWSLRVLATGDVGSDTDVCGCKVRRLGGLARRVHAVKARPGALVVDAGDLFFRTFGIDPEHHPQARLTAERHADALCEMGAAAMAVGERDLALGVPYLRELGRRAEVELLSANLVFAKTGTAAFPGFTVVEASGHRVGLVGVSPALPPGDPSWPAYEAAGVRSAPLLPSVREMARAAELEGAEVLVALSHIGFEASERLVAALPPGTFALVLVAGEGQPRDAVLSRDRKTAFIGLGDRGKYLGDVEMRFAGGGAFVDRSAVERERALLEELEARVERLAGAPAQADLRGRLERRAEKLRRSLAEAEATGGDDFSAELVAIEEAAPRDPGHGAPSSADGE